METIRELRGSYDNNDCIIQVGIPNDTILCAAILSAGIIIANRRDILSYFYEKDVMDPTGFTDTMDMVERGEYAKFNELCEKSTNKKSWTMEFVGEINSWLLQKPA